VALATGTRLGPYEVTVHIGAGGRGEVYRARDTKLNRDVALKAYRKRTRSRVLYVSSWPSDQRHGRKDLRGRDDQHRKRQLAGVQAETPMTSRFE
jgi:serine/threonine protein kinase